MYEVVLIVCLMSSPTSCMKLHPGEPMSAMGCMVSGQRYASEWLDEHPKWGLKGWRCEDVQHPSQRPT